MPRNLIDITDLSVEEIDQLIATAEDIIANPVKVPGRLRPQAAGNALLRALHPDPALLRVRHAGPGRQHPGLL